MQMHREQPALDQVRLLRLAQADRRVGLAHGEVDFLVVEDQLQLEIGIELKELLCALGEPAGAETHRGRHPQLAGRLLARLGQLHAHLLEPLQDVAGGVEEQFALFRQHQAAGMAVEEGGPDFLLQRRDLPADRRLAEIQDVRRMGERSRFGGGVKDPQFIPVESHRSLSPDGLRPGRHDACPHQLLGSLPLVFHGLNGQPFLCFERRHAAHARSRHRLTVHVVGDVTRGKDARNRGLRRARFDPQIA